MWVSRFRAIARNVKQLELFDVTHVLNAAEGHKFNQVDTSAADYTGAGMQYHGIPAVDVMNFPLHKYFSGSSQFIDGALESGGKSLQYQERIQDFYVEGAPTLPERDGGAPTYDFAIFSSKKPHEITFTYSSIQNWRDLVSHIVNQLHKLLPDMEPDMGPTPSPFPWILEEYI